MPFVPNDRRAPLQRGDLQPEVPGDLCYLEYVRLVEAWKKERRWKTAHNLLCSLFGYTDGKAAKMLAYLVFFNIHVMPYEFEMRDKNGDI